MSYLCTVSGLVAAQFGSEGSTTTRGDDEVNDPLRGLRGVLQVTFVEKASVRRGERQKG